MIILWVRKARKDKQNKSAKEAETSFREHDEMMKKFRLGHAELETIDDDDILTGDGNLLAPVRHVKLAEHAQN
jgi:hypothetical protein